MADYTGFTLDQVEAALAPGEPQTMRTVAERVDAVRGDLKSVADEIPPGVGKVVGVTWDTPAAHTFQTSVGNRFVARVDKVAKRLPQVVSALTAGASALESAKAQIVALKTQRDGYVTGLPAGQTADQATLDGYDKAAAAILSNLGVGYANGVTRIKVQPDEDLTKDRNDPAAKDPMAVPKDPASKDPAKDPAKGRPDGTGAGSPKAEPSGPDNQSKAPPDPAPSNPTPSNPAPSTTKNLALEPPTGDNERLFKDPPVSGLINTSGNPSGGPPFHHLDLLNSNLNGPTDDPFANSGIGGDKSLVYEPPGSVDHHFTGVPSLGLTSGTHDPSTVLTSFGPTTPAPSLVTGTGPPVASTVTTGQGMPPYLGGSFGGGGLSYGIRAPLTSAGERAAQRLPTTGVPEPEPVQLGRPGTPLSPYVGHSSQAGAFGAGEGQEERSTWLVGDENWTDEQVPENTLGRPPAAGGDRG